MPSYDTIGELFTAHRVAQELTQQELASLASCGVSTVSRLELDGSVPRAMNLAKLALVLHVTPEQLEAFGQDLAADTLRRSLDGHTLNLRAAYAALVDVEITLNKLGFDVMLSQPETGVLVLRCETAKRSLDTDSLRSASALVPFTSR